MTLAPDPQPAVPSPERGAATPSATLDPTVLLNGERVGGRRRRRVPGNLDIWIPGGVLALMTLACYLGPAMAGLPDPLASELRDANLPLFSPDHLLGTDTIGRDVLSRILHGGRLSLEVAVLTNVIGLVLGGALGVVAGFRRGRFDSITMRLLDVLLAFPGLVLSIVIASYLGPSKKNVIFAISFFSIPAFARLARAATLRLREQVYVTAAGLSGQRDGTIITRHVVPNVAPQLLTYSLLHVGIVIVIESALSFLGVGVPPPAPSWGNMISTGQVYLATDPALVLVPSAFLFVTVVAVNVLGDALRSRWATV
jgi:peptide/nickel transport system permease protein